MFNNNPRIGQEILDVPMGDMIRQMAFAIAEGQMALDENSIEVAEMMGGLDTITETINGKEVVTFTDSRVFFGKERVSISDAVTIYNTTTDDSIKSQIFRPAYTNVGTGGDSSFDTSTGNFVNTGTTHEDNTDSYNTDTFQQVVTEDGGVYSIDETKIELVSSASPALTEIFIPQRLSMLELGFTPTFYQFVDTIIEAKVSIKFTREGSSSVNVKTDSKTRSASIGFRRGQIKAKRNITTTQVNANYSQKYSYSAEGSSLMRTKLVPVPPPAILEQRIQEQMEIARGLATNN